MKVYGMGEKKTPKPFIVACDKFVYIESLKAVRQSKTAPYRFHHFLLRTNTWVPWYLGLCRSSSSKPSRAAMNRESLAKP